MKSSLRQEIINFVKENNCNMRISLSTGTATLSLEIPVVNAIEETSKLMAYDKFGDPDISTDEAITLNLNDKIRGIQEALGWIPIICSMMYSDVKIFEMFARVITPLLINMTEKRPFPQKIDVVFKSIGDMSAKTISIHEFEPN